uniref:CDP-alcohol phosphatidyltransferase family protein n=1 Tax=Olsenella timonensis TaxID=1805478 RepID=UPI00094E9E7B
MSERTQRVKGRVKTIADADAAETQAMDAAESPIGTSENPSSQVFTLANLITFCRLGLTVAFLVLFAGGHHRTSALVCYVVAASTDFLDGQIARRTQTVSWLGKIMDPVMDRVLLFTGVLGLLIVGDLPMWVPAFVIGRDLYLGVGGLILQHFRRRPIDVVYVGKAATALLMVGFCDLLLGLPVVDGLGLVNVPWLPGLNSQPAALGIFFVYAGVICSLVTAVVYTGKGIQVIRDSRRSGATS